MSEPTDYIRICSKCGRFILPNGEADESRPALAKLECMTREDLTHGYCLEHWREANEQIERMRARRYRESGLSEWGHAAGR